MKMKAITLFSAILMSSTLARAEDTRSLPGVREMEIEDSDLKTYTNKMAEAGLPALPPADRPYLEGVREMEIKDSDLKTYTDDMAGAGLPALPPASNSGE